MENFDSYKNLQGFEKEIYFKALISVANADNNFNEIEREYLFDQARLLNFDIASIMEKKFTTSELNLKESSSITKKLLIRDCIALAYIDNKYTDAEKFRINEIAINAGLTPKEVETIEKWLIDYWNIMDKAEEIFA